ncbi:LysR family transcriptional regulator [Nonomuraea sp. M3C6]|uniref:LysR family transcriptional regulator n=1 Tax=Nonomuraea marmarensis TaxID=3351344 RepID=A0ABW7A644_9ACTN
MDAHIRDLRYFVAVAEELSFTRAAAERLYIAQPSLSRQIRRLELSMRATLFERDRRTVSLTAAGAALLPEARRIIEQWEGAQRAVAAARADRILVIGFQTRIGRGLVPSIRETLPEWDLRFRQVAWSDPTVGLGDRHVDVAIAWLPLPDTGEYDWTVVSTEERWVALPAAHRLASRAEVEFAELAEEPFVAFPVSAGPMRDFWLAGDQRSAPAVVGAEAETAEEAFELVASGRAVVLVSAGNAELYGRDDVVSRPVAGLPPSRLAIVWRRDDRREAVRALVEASVRCLCGSSGSPATGSSQAPRGGR